MRRENVPMPGWVLANLSQQFSVDFTPIKKRKKNSIPPPSPARSFASSTSSSVSSASLHSSSPAHRVWPLVCLDHKMYRSPAPNMLRSGSSWEFVAEPTLQQKESRGWRCSWGHSYSRVPATAALPWAEGERRTTTTSSSSKYLEGNFLKHLKDLKAKKIWCKLWLRDVTQQQHPPQNKLSVYPPTFRYEGK